MIHPVWLAVVGFIVWMFGDTKPSDPIDEDLRQWMKDNHIGYH
jgi:hypothetical protein